MLLIIFIIIAIYLGLIGSFVYGFDKVLVFKVFDDAPKTKFSMIIPFRNEATHLEALINSIAELNYPKTHFEVLMIDDDSEDTSVELIKALKSKHSALNLSVLKNERKTNAPKKDAITVGVKHAKSAWIVTTDADCLLPKYWLDIYDNFIGHHSPNLVTGPVIYHNGNRFIDRFQILDLLSLQGVTIGSFGIGRPMMCNGANLAYSKSLFNEVKGFDGNTHIASGDDVFMLEKALKHDKDKVHYIKNNLLTVKTTTESNLSDLLKQRVRWASKTSNYNSLFGKLTGLIVILMNALILCLPLFYFVGFISAKSLLYTFVIKVLIDFLLIYKSARFLEQDQFITSFITSSFIYPFFSTYVAVLSVFRDYKWKGRHYSK